MHKQHRRQPEHTGAEQHPGQSQRADPSAEASEQLGIAAAEPYPAAKLAVKPADQGETDETGSGADQPLSERRPEAGPGDGEPGRDQGQGQEIGQPVMLGIERGQRQQPQPEHEAEQSERQRMGEQGDQADQGGGELDAEMAAVDRCAAASAAAVQRGVGQDRHEIAHAQWGATAFASRAAGDDAAALRPADQQGGDEAADDGAEHETRSLEKNGRCAFVHSPAAARMRRAKTRCGRSIIRPSSESAPTSGLASNASTTRRA